MKTRPEEKRSSPSRRRFLRQSAAGALGLSALSKAGGAMAQTLSPDTIPAQTGVPSGIVRLNFNENPAGPSPKALEAIRSHLHEMNLYGMNTTALLMKLNQMAGIDFSDLDLSRRSDLNEMWRKNRVFLSDGSGNLLRAAAFTLLRQGGEVVEAEPAYGDVSEHADFMDSELGINVKTVRVPLTRDMRHDLDGMRSAVHSRTRLVVVTNPNNPTGTIVTPASLERFILSIPEEVVVLVDEAYVEYVQAPGFRSMAHLAISRPNVLVTRTFSKVYGLPGLRMGYALGMPDTFKHFWMHTSFPSPIAIHAAGAAVDDAPHVANSKQTTWRGRDFLYSRLDEMGLTYVQTESNFLIVDVGDSDRITRELARSGVFVRNAERLWKLNGHIRVSVGTDSDNDAFVNALRRIIT
jgi:histidinol-phosphate aminotransferase